MIFTIKSLNKSGVSSEIYIVILFMITHLNVELFFIFTFHYCKVVSYDHNHFTIITGDEGNKSHMSLHLACFSVACQSQQWHLHLPMSMKGRSGSHATICCSCIFMLRWWWFFQVFSFVFSSLMRRHSTISAKALLTNSRYSCLNHQMSSLE